MRMRKLRAVLSWAAISLLLVTSLAAAESYFGIYAGAPFPRHPLRNDTKFSEFPRLSPTGGVTRTLTDVTVKDEGFDTSPILGGKFGHFLEPLPFLGFELDVFNIFGPDINPDRTRTLEPKGLPSLKSPLSEFIDVGDKISLNITGVTLNAVGRFGMMRSADFPNGRFQPYLGVGGGWINAEIETPNARRGLDGDVDKDVLGAQG